MPKISKYNYSFLKSFLDLSVSVLVIMLLIPLIIPILIIEMVSKGSIIFRQERVGNKGKTFIIYKFRTMKINSERMLLKYKNINEADGPVFKIKNDPRFTKIGRLLSHTGLDELPQFINVLKGNMSMVGPRPLPTFEYEKLNKKQKIRNLIKPGITSLWVINGTHNLSFSKWMYLDKIYIEEANLLLDIKILIKTTFIPIMVILNYIFDK